MQFLFANHFWDWLKGLRHKIWLNLLRHSFQSKWVTDFSLGMMHCVAKWPMMGRFFFEKQFEKHFDYPLTARIKISHFKAILRLCKMSIIAISLRWSLLSLIERAETQNLVEFTAAQFSVKVSYRFFFKNDALCGKMAYDTLNVLKSSLKSFLIYPLTNLERKYLSSKRFLGFAGWVSLKFLFADHFRVWLKGLSDRILWNLQRHSFQSKWVTVFSLRMIHCVAKWPMIRWIFWKTVWKAFWFTR